MENRVEVKKTAYDKAYQKYPTLTIITTFFFYKRYGFQNFF